MNRVTAFLPLPIHRGSGGRRALRLVGLIAATAAVLATAACQPQQSPPTPSEAARSYLQALADGDAAAANGLSTEPTEDYPLPADDSLDGAVTTISDLVVAEVDVDDRDSADVPVSYSLGSEKQQAELSLRKVDEKWLVSSGLEGEAQLTWAGFTDFIGPWAQLSEVKAGPTVVGDLAHTATFYPGVYTLTADLGPYAELVTDTAAFAVTPPFGNVEFEMNLAPTKQLSTEVAEFLAKDLDTMVDNAGDGWPSIFYGDNGPGGWRALEESLEGVSLDWDVSLPVRVTSWQPDHGKLIYATASLYGHWKKGSKSGEVNIPIVTDVLARPMPDSLDTLDVVPTYWSFAS